MKHARINSTEYVKFDDKARTYMKTLPLNTQKDNDHNNPQIWQTLTGFGIAGTAILTKEGKELINAKTMATEVSFDYTFNPETNTAQFDQLNLWENIKRQIHPTRIRKPNEDRFWCYIQHIWVPLNNGYRLMLKTNDLDTELREFLTTAEQCSYIPMPIHTKMEKFQVYVIDTGKSAVENSEDLRHYGENRHIGNHLLSLENAIMTKGKVSKSTQTRFTVSPEQIINNTWTRKVIRTSLYTTVHVGNPDTLQG